MENDKEGDVRVPLVFAVFFLCVTTGGVILVIYVFVPSLSKPWHPSAALFLIGAPWIFWLLTYLYTLLRCCCAASPPAPGPTPAAVNHQISRRPSTTSGSSEIPLTNSV